ncbi:relaxosome protein [Pseudomonas syringae]|uniref:plasmid mobilization protein n=1 Tax=Pseudomonas syringae TaxID=317 RepID=UPI000BB64D3C|nr:relaxosome protein [Pseudomonas syringae]PBP65872.1 relaxosome protein [Pseudomonas syringae]
MAEKVNKSCAVSCRFTDEQFARFAEPIAQSSLKPARFFRDLVISRSPTFEQSAIYKKRMQQIFEKSGHALNRVAYSANSAPYNGTLYQKQYLHWLNKLNAIQQLLLTVLPETAPPKPSRSVHNGNRGSPNESGKKVHIIRFRLTQDEMAQFDDMIKRAGCSASDFFRELILNKAPVFREFTGFRKRIVFIVNKAGNNISQLAYIAKAASDRGIITDSVRDKWYETLMVIETILLAGIEYAD